VREIGKTGFSVREFAMRHGMSPVSLSAWLRGARQPKFSNVEKIAGALGLPIEKISDYHMPDLASADAPDILSGLYQECAKTGDTQGIAILDRVSKRLVHKLTADIEIGEGSDVKKIEGDRWREVPVLSIAQAAGYEPALEPLCDYLREVTDKMAAFVDVRDNYFALEISGDSMAPDYPDGSIALIAAGDFPQRGDLVVAKLADGQVVIKEYHRKDNVITLSSINPSGRKYEWHCKEQPGYVQWMWPVIEVTLRPRSKRWAEARGVGK